MRIIPVIDLRAGLAVRGCRGARDRYRPVMSCLAGGALSGGGQADLSDPIALLLAYRRALRVRRVYVADLDRIMRSGSNDALLNELLDTAPEIDLLWDGGVSDLSSLDIAGGRPRLQPVVGTETLRAIETLSELAHAAPGAPPALSLDLNESGVVSRSAAIAALGEEALLWEAARCGIRTVVLLCLGRVGSGDGLPRERLARLRVSVPHLEFLAGGGVRDLEDLKFLRGAGFAGALLATALHEGRITPRALEDEGLLD